MAKRVPQCARCGQPLTDRDLVTVMHGEWYHQRCTRIVASERLVGRTQSKIKRSKKRIQKSQPRIGKRRRAG